MGLILTRRAILAPAWDDAPIDRPRARGAWWRRLLAGAAGNTRLQPGTCCGCGFGCGSCSIPQTNLTCSYSYTLTAPCWGTISSSGSLPLIFDGGHLWASSPLGISPGLCPTGITFTLTCTSSVVVFELDQGTTANCSTSTGGHITTSSLSCGSGFTMVMSTSVPCLAASSGSWNITVSP